LSVMPQATFALGLKTLTDLIVFPAHALLILKERLREQEAKGGYQKGSVDRPRSGSRTCPVPGAGGMSNPPAGRMGAIRVGR